jgi:hypothetical protein
MSEDITCEKMGKLHLQQNSDVTLCAESIASVARVPGKELHVGWPANEDVTNYI